MQTPILGKFITETLRLLPQSEFLQTTHGTSKIMVENCTLLEVNAAKIVLADRINLLTKLTPSVNSDGSPPSTENVHSFIHAVYSRIVGLNHVGVSYFCDDIKDELGYYQKSLIGTSFHIYQEKADNKYQKWFFVGNTANWKSPLVEIVLNTSESSTSLKWVPHFQIDMDTTLSVQELEKTLTEYFGKNVWKWRLNVPKHGIVLEMELLGEYKGIKIALGVGTNLRNTKYHRRKILKEIE